MKLYVANTTKQYHIFMYHLPEGDAAYQEVGKSKDEQGRLVLRPSASMQPIEPGKQILVGNRDLSPEAVASVIQQHESYGLRNVKDLDRERDYIGLVYRIDKYVEFSVIGECILSNDNFLDERARDIREDTSAAVASQIQETMAQAGVDVPRVEITMVEEPEKRGAEPTISEGYEILKNGVTSRRGGMESTRRGPREESCGSLSSPFNS